jgi:hypothetical protein
MALEIVPTELWQTILRYAIAVGGCRAPPSDTNQCFSLLRYQFSSKQTQSTRADTKTVSDGMTTEDHTGSRSVNETLSDGFTRHGMYISGGLIIVL